MKKRALLMSPALLILLAFAAAPLVIMFYYSFLSDAYPAVFTLENYTSFFTKSFYLMLTWRTIGISAVVTLICILIGYPMAFVLTRVLTRGKNLILLLVIIPFWSSQLVRVYSWLSVLRDDGLLHIFLKWFGLFTDSGPGILFTWTAVIIGLVHIFCPYMIITAYMALEKIGPELLEASQNLGATPVTTFFRVILPLSKSGIITGSILVFVPCLGSFIEPRILGGVNGSMIGTVIQDQFFEIFGWNFGAAIAFLLLILVLVSMSVLNRFRGGAENA
ncbi:MAG: ABC transporter permease [Anaerolineae bacterium]|nr:ABC transporter permease [Anaerolineae bacterium]